MRPSLATQSQERVVPSCKKPRLTISYMSYQGDTRSPDYGSDGRLKGKRCSKTGWYEVVQKLKATSEALTAWWDMQDVFWDAMSVYMCQELHAQLWVWIQDIGIFLYSRHGLAPGAQSSKPGSVPSVDSIVQQLQ